MPRFNRLLRLLPLFSTLLAMAAGASAAAVPVTNFSFENPDIDSVGLDTPGWDSLLGAQSQTTGEFQNPSDNKNGDQIMQGIDGQQAAFLFNTSGAGLRQLLTTTFTVGQAYNLTVAANGGFGAAAGLTTPLGTTIQLQLFYVRNGADTVIASKDIVYSSDLVAADPPPISTLFDFSAFLSTVHAGDLWAGQQIGIELVATNDMGGGGGWDVDNFRLVTVPEPATAGLLLAGGALLGWRRRRA